MGQNKIEIIYENDDIIVINKPTGVSVTKERSGAAELTEVLSGQLGCEAVSNLRLVHRFDKLTSGVMILAKNVEGQSHYCELFAKRLIHKTYLAIVTGVMTDKEGTINAPLQRDRKDTMRMCIAGKKGKESITKWRVIADFGVNALLAVSPVTGRTHQIRVHLPSVGLPLAIDPVYGSKRGLFLSDFKPDYRLSQGQVEKALMERLTLHAYQIELQQGRQSCFVAGLDKKFKAAIKMLTKHNPKGLDAFENGDDFSKIMNGERVDFRIKRASF